MFTRPPKVYNNQLTIRYAIKLNQIQSGYTPGVDDSLSQFFIRIKKKPNPIEFKCLTLRRAEGLSVIFHHNVSRRNLSAGTAAGPLYVARTNIDNTIIHQRFPRHIGGVLSRREKKNGKK